MATVRACFHSNQYPIWWPLYVRVSIVISTQSGGQCNGDAEGARPRGAILAETDVSNEGASRQSAG